MPKIRRKIHEIHEKYFEKHRQDKSSVRKIDKAMATIGVFGPMATFIQVFHIFTTKAVAGISPISWLGYTVVSVCWVAYGFFYKDKPLVIVNSLSFVMSSLVFTGYMLFR